jgi:hypothetical protein
MRHFLALPLAISPLARRVRVTAVAAALVAIAGGAKRRAPRFAGAAQPAVAVAVIAVTAEKEDLAARRPRAGHESQRFQAPSARARGSGPTRLDVRSTCCWIASPCWSGRGLGATNSGPLLFRPAGYVATGEVRDRPVFGRARARRQNVQNHALSGERRQLGTQGTGAVAAPLYVGSTAGRLQTTAGATGYVINGAKVGSYASTSLSDAATVQLVWPMYDGRNQ